VSGTKLITDNRRARHDYHLLDRIEAGLQLTGTEVKSLRAGGAQLGQAYAEIRDGEAWLVGASIAEYARGQHRQPPSRARPQAPAPPPRDRLALREGAREGADARADAALLQGRRVKVELALARGKERIDKRRDLAERDAKRQMERALKARR
jgi:SsrA-binding protein